MRPVDQRRSLPPEEPVGDCFSACIASILELPLEDVPVFSALPSARDGTWIHAANDWLRIRGYCICAFEERNMMCPSPECFHIVSGPHPDMPEEGHPGHAVVAYGDRVVHDPNRLRKGITEIRYRWLLVPTDWRHVKTPVPPPPPAAEPSHDTLDSVRTILTLSMAIAWITILIMMAYGNCR